MTMLTGRQLLQLVNFFSDYLDHVHYLINYIFLFKLSYSIYKIYHDPRRPCKRGHEGDGCQHL